MKRLLGFGAAIAALTYFFDPQNGARRRNMTRDRFLSLFRQGGRTAERAGRAVAAEAHGLPLWRYLGGTAARTREMRRSELVTVPSFSAQLAAGSSTSA